jgi:hypothetical protein
VRLNNCTSLVRSSKIMCVANAWRATLIAPDLPRPPRCAHIMKGKRAADASMPSHVMRKDCWICVNPGKAQRPATWPM